MQLNSKQLSALRTWVVNLNDHVDEGIINTQPYRVEFIRGDRRITLSNEEVFEWLSLIFGEETKGE